MTLQLKTLKKLSKEDRFVDVYIDKLEESNYGYIRKVNEHFLLLERYREHGAEAGIIIYPLESVSRVRWDNNEIRNAEKLVKRDKSKKSITGQIKIDSIQTVLRSVGKTFGYACIEFKSSSSDLILIGEVKDVDETSVLVHEYGTKASMDRGETLLMLNMIDCVSAGDHYEESILRLHRMKKK